MKKLSIVIVVVMAFALASCSAPSKLVNTATHVTVNVAQPVTAVFADLDVSSKKITFFYIPSKTVVDAGENNVVDSAIREALINAGNYDVLVGLEMQKKYNGEGEIESITVTGYPAKYVNFRSPGDEYLREISKSGAANDKKNGLLNVLKLSK